MRKIKFKKIILIVSIILIVFIAFYLSRLVYCRVEVSNIHTLNYSSYGWGVVLVEYNLDFDNDLAEVNYYDYDGTLSSHSEKVFSAEQQDDVKSAFIISLMPLWKSNYNNPGVMDGDHWLLKVTYGEKEKQTYGSNAYPRLYRVAYDAIRSAAN